MQQKNSAEFHRFFFSEKIGRAVFWTSERNFHFTQENRGIRFSRFSRLANIRDPFYFLFFFLWHTLPRRNLLPEGRYDENGENRAEVRDFYVLILYRVLNSNTPEILKSKLRKIKVVQIKSRTLDHFNQRLTYKLNCTPPFEERSYMNRPMQLTWV